MGYFALGWTIVDGELISESHTFKTFQDAEHWLAKSKNVCHIIGPVRDLSKHLMYAQGVKDELLIEDVQREIEANSKGTL